MISLEAKAIQGVGQQTLNMTNAKELLVAVLSESANNVLPEVDIGGHLLNRAFDQELFDSPNVLYQHLFFISEAEIADILANTSDAPTAVRVVTRGTAGNPAQTGVSVAVAINNDGAVTRRAVNSNAANSVNGPLGVECEVGATSQAADSIVSLCVYAPGNRTVQGWSVNVAAFFDLEAANTDASFAGGTKEVAAGGDLIKVGWNSVQGSAYLMSAISYDDATVVADFIDVTVTKGDLPYTLNESGGRMRDPLTLEVVAPGDPQISNVNDPWRPGQTGTVTGQDFAGATAVTGTEGVNVVDQPITGSGSTS